MSSVEELKTKSLAELSDLLVVCQKDHFKMRMATGSDQTIPPHKYKAVKKQIARIKTVMNELERGKE